MLGGSSELITPKEVNNKLNEAFHEKFHRGVLKGASNIFSVRVRTGNFSPPESPRSSVAPRQYLLWNDQGASSLRFGESIRLHNRNDLPRDQKLEKNIGLVLEPNRILWVLKVFVEHNC